jgi:hypothetical protein
MQHIKFLIPSILLSFSFTTAYTQEEEDDVPFDFTSDHYLAPPYVFYDTIPVNPMFMPVVFTGKVLPDDIQLYTPVEYARKPQYIPVPDSIHLFEDKLFYQELNRKAYLYLTYNKPNVIKYTSLNLPKDIPVAKEIRNTPSPIVFHSTRDVDFTSFAPDAIPVKRRYWTASYETSLQFSQNHVSENWYKGGVSNFNMQFINKFRHEYEKNKIKISTTAEYKLSIYTTSTDTLRTYRIGDDAFSIINTYGYRAFDKWFYSLSLDLKTQFLDNFYENKRDLKSSSLMSPMSLNLGLGMEYKLTRDFPSERYRKIDISVNIAPFAYNMKYLKDDMVDKNRHGFIVDGDSLNFIKTIGSKIISTVQFSLNRNISWNTKIYYFSNYENTEIECENTLNLAINKFFSTRIYFDIRFDDKVTKANPEDSYFQYYEILSFGFNYRF